MQAIDLESCLTFVYANRLAADILKDKAQKLFETLSSVNDSVLRASLEYTARSSLLRALRHERLANLQERDMGSRCYCKSRAPIH
ncbi:hypothetical protein SAMN05443244_0815 [Terriglobus roseus]|uniref:Uncharacterized protein n=1 Tax=Terriglobus roseus TaxID=392734 RepID=A0A1H4JU94_9BACT|nr:hypothetical protein SAMN05443244_0815 [Terriglobus roseus]